MTGEVIAVIAMAEDFCSTPSKLADGTVRTDGAISAKTILAYNVSHTAALSRP